MSVGNHLKMPDNRRVLALLELGSSYALELLQIAYKKRYFRML
jgi:hypothetical protein